MAKKRELLERDIEAYLRKKAMQAGKQPYKFTSPNRRSVPDQIIFGDRGSVANSVLRKLQESKLFRAEVTLREFELMAVLVGDAAMAETITFVECKRPNGKPTESQQREHEKLRNRGFTVLLVDNKQQIDELYSLED